jgi:hypothetical protein
LPRCLPSSKSEFKLVTIVVDVTVNGEVPVATVNFYYVLKVLTPLTVCAVVRVTYLPSNNPG